MPDSKSMMYVKLFNAVTDAIIMLQAAQSETEEIFVNQEDTQVIQLKRPDRKDWLMKKLADNGLKNFDKQDLDTQLFKITIIEMLMLTVRVKAKDYHEAKQIVSDDWANSKYILNADNFVGVEFEAELIEREWCREIRIT